MTSPGHFPLSRTGCLLAIKGFICQEPFVAWISGFRPNHLYGLPAGAHFRDDVEIKSANLLRNAGSYRSCT